VCTVRSCPPLVGRYQPIRFVALAGPIVSLLPVRNGAADLHQHLASVSRFADAVVALDDGSTDDTRAILEACPLVNVVLTNPRRESYAGWDDAANRNRLLDAALELEPSWVMSLDADELIAADDASAFRTFLRESADPACAYEFRVYRMIDDVDHYDIANLWVARCFSPRPGHTFPSDRLHFVPVPTAIPRQNWRRTSIRIQHLGSMNPTRRRGRYEKYREADPANEWQSSYENLLEPPVLTRAWWARGPHLPALMNKPAVDPRPLGPGEPAISAVVIARDDESRIEQAVGAVVRQELDEPYEVIVVTSGTDETAAVARRAFPDVTVVELDHPALPGEARNVGLHLARGRYVSFPGSHVELAPGCLAARLAAHRQGWAMVTGTMLNGTSTWAGWASYFLDNSAVLPGRPSFAWEKAPLRCSYHREALLEVGGFPEGVRAGEDTEVNDELFRRGYGAYRERTAMTYHHSPCRRPGRLMVHHFQRGRARGRILASARSEPAARGSRGLGRFRSWSVSHRLRWVHENVKRWGGGLRYRYWLAFPLVVAGAIAACAGGSYELVVRLNGLGRPQKAANHRTSRPDSER
jgi:glycosyltransferase involved in cell wall biosynthesis